MDQNAPIFDLVRDDFVPVNLEQIIPNFVSKHVRTFVDKWAKNHPNDTTPMEFGAEESFAAVVMADVSGYSKLTSVLAERGPIGSELLSKTMKGYLDKIIQIILMHGGDIVKFAGDAVIFYWTSPGPVDASSSAEDIIRGDVVLKACLCCLELLNKLGTYSVDIPDCSTKELRIHLGIGAGSVFDVHVGGEPGRWEHFIAGDAVKQLATVLDLANAGQLAMSHNALKFFQAVIDIGSVTLGSYDKRCIIVTGLEQAKRKVPAPPPQAGEDLELWEIAPKESNIELYKQFINYNALFKLQADINQSKLFQLESGLAELLSLYELRQVTCLFLKIGGFKFESVDSVHDAQALLTIVQKSLKKYEGSLRQFHCDDKGAVILCFFGLPPLAHENDASFGLKAALEICQDFQTFFKIDAPPDPILVKDTNGTSSDEISFTSSFSATGILPDFRFESKERSSHTRHSFSGGATNTSSFTNFPSSNSKTLKKETFLEKKLEPKLSYDPDNVFSIGLTTGVVSIGGVGNAIRTEYAVMGDSINMAARIMCHPFCKNTLICDDRTYGLCESEFDFQKLGTTKVKGKSNAIAIFKPKAVKTNAKINTEVKISNHQDIIGRKKEKTAIVNALATFTTQQDPQVIIFEGEGGQGLSTLGKFVKKEAHRINWLTSSGSSTEMEKSTPLFIYRDIVSDLLSLIEVSQIGANGLLIFDPSNNTSTVKKESYIKQKTQSTLQLLEDRSLHRLSSSPFKDIVNSNAYTNPFESLKASSGGVDGPLSHMDILSGPEFEERVRLALIKIGENLELTPLFDLILPFDFSERNPSNMITGRLRMKELGELIRRILNKLSMENPLVLILHEVQWMDSSGWELTNDILNSCPEILLFVFSRPESSYEDRENLSFYQKLKHNPKSKLNIVEGLSLTETIELIIQYWASPFIKKVNLTVASNIHRRSNGNILFTKSLIIALKESGQTRVSDSGVLETLTSEFNFDRIVPGSDMESTIVAQFDRLDRNFQLFLKVASVIGQRFLLDDVLYFLSNLSGWTEIKGNFTLMVHSIESMDKYRFLKRIETASDGIVYLFKSAVVRKCIYTMMVLGQRQQLHSLVATYYEKVLDDGNRHRLLVPLYEHFMESDDRNMLKKLRYLEAVSHFNYEKQSMADTIRNYNDLISRVRKLQEQTGLQLYNRLTISTWRRELAEAQFFRNDIQGAENTLKESLNLIGHGPPTSRFGQWVSYLKDLRSVKRYYSSASKSQNLFPDSKSNVTFNSLPRIQQAPSIQLSIQTGRSLSKACPIMCKRISPPINDRRLSSHYHTRLSLSLLAQLYLQTERLPELYQTTLMGLAYCEKFPKDSVYLKFIVFLGYTTWILDRRGTSSLLYLNQSEAFDKRVDLSASSIVFYCSATIRFLMGLWLDALKKVDSLLSISLSSGDFHYREKAMRLKSIIQFHSGQSNQSLVTARELYACSVHEDFWRGKLWGCELILENLLLKSNSAAEEIAEIIWIMKGFMEKADKDILDDPQISIICKGILGLAEYRLGIVGDMVLLTQQIQSLLKKIKPGHWCHLLGLLDVCKLIFSLQDDGSLEVSVKVSLSQFCFNVGTQIQSMKFVSISSSLSCLYLGLGKLLSKKSPSQALSIWSSLNPAPDTHIGRLLTSKIAFYSNNNSDFYSKPNFKITTILAQPILKRVLRSLTLSGS